MRLKLRKKTILAVILLAAGTGLLYTGFRLAVPSIEAFKHNRLAASANQQLFKTYSALDGTFKYQLPEAWTTREESFSGGEVVYHMYFLSKDKLISGYVQVWKLNQPLKQFIDVSKNAAAGAADFKFLNTKEIMSGNRPGYLLEYSRPNAGGDYYRGYEAFVQGSGNKVYRISFFVLERDWKNHYPILFDRMINAMEVTP